MIFSEEQRIRALKEEYPKGTRIHLVSMKDCQALAPGTEGTVDHIDDIGTIHVNWDNGSTLGLIIGDDLFWKLPGEAR